MEMSSLYSIIFPSSTPVTMSTLTAEYIVDASSSNLVYNLPAITCDGIRFNLSRIDSKTTTVTINASGSDTISSKTGVFSSSVTLPNNTSIDMVSLSQVWYILSKTQTSTAGTAQYCCNFMDNNGNNFMNYNSNSSIIAAYLPFPGSSTGFTINSFTAATSNYASSIFVDNHGIKIVNSGGSDILVDLTSNNLSFPIFFTDATANRTNIPSSLSYIYIECIFGPFSNASYDLYSVIIN